MAVDIQSLDLEEMTDLLGLLQEAVWDTAYVNNLPDSAFLYVEPGGSKDSEGKTTPRDLRHFPVKDSGGAVDMPHLRNAMSRIPQSNLSDAIKARCTSKAQAMMPKMESIDATIEGDFISLSEKALRPSGEAQIKIIQPGWGSSGYYGAEMLERDGPAVFKTGTKMFWDHPTSTEAAERPERSLRDLAAVTTSPARYIANGPEGPGLYASAKVNENFKPIVEELAPHIGVSIRAQGQGKQGSAEGRSGRIIERLVPSPMQSIDFVTAPGAGGKVVQLFESARSSEHKEVLVDEKEATQLRESVTALQTQMTALQEAVKAAETQRDEIKAERDRLREGQTLQEAKGLVGAQVGAANLPDVTKARLIERLSVNPPIKDGALDKDALKTAVEAAVADETEYLTKVTGSPIRGMNSTVSTSESAVVQEATKQLEDVFTRFGMSESVAKAAAAGRN